jgi:hypothetical protein
MSEEISQVLQVAKHGGKFTRSQLFQKMEDLAKRHFLTPGVSPSQAFAKFVMTDEGLQLLAIQMAMPGRDVEPETPVAKSGGEDDWDRLVRLTKKAAGCTESQAVDAALSTEGGRYAFAKRKRADRIATGEFSKADMQCLDAIAGEQELSLEMRKRGSRTAYEDLFDEIKRTHPNLSDGKAHDFARQRDVRAWLDHKSQKMGGGGLPQHRNQYETSGKQPPKATSGREGPTSPQWQSRHSGSPPTTPEPKPERMSETPTVKVQKRLALVKKNSGWAAHGREQAVWQAFVKAFDGDEDQAAPAFGVFTNAVDQSRRDGMTRWDAFMHAISEFPALWNAAKQHTIKRSLAAA